VALRQVTADVLAEASGRRHRTDPVAAGHGGPAGNARLTATTGLVLLVLCLAEGPALMLAGPRSGVPGGGLRPTALAIILVVAAIAATLLLGTADAWQHAGRHHVAVPKKATASQLLRRPLAAA
jgi:hypothetical protein